MVFQKKNQIYLTQHFTIVKAENSLVGKLYEAKNVDQTVSKLLSCEMFSRVLAPF